MKYLLPLMLLLSSVAFSQTYTANYMIVREMSVDSVVVSKSSLHKIPTLVDISPKRVKITSSMLELDLYGEALLAKKIIIYRNKFGELFVIKATRKGLIIIGDKEYILTNSLK